HPEPPTGSLSLPGPADLPPPRGPTLGLPPRPPAEPAPPEVPGYEVLSELGRGGMGVVYLARQVTLGRLAAPKLILAGEHAGEDDRARFRREAEAVARLAHPNIVAVFEAGEHAGRAYLCLEFCPSGSLADRLAAAPLAPAEAARLVGQLAGGVA